MGSKKISSADTTNMDGISYADTPQGAGSTFDYAAATLDTKELTGDESGNVEYMCEWSKWYGYYKATPEVQSIIDRKAVWVVGKGFKADKKTKDALMKIRGNGKDTFNGIMSNAVLTYSIGGDFYAEIVKERKLLFKKLVNLKPLNPGTIKTIANKFGIIKRYEQWIDGKKVNTFEPEDMFHLCWRKVADQIHGNGISNYEEIIKMRNESMKDMKTLFHRYVKPLLIISVDTDNATEIAAFKVKVDKTVELSENLIVPKDTVSGIDKMSIPQFSSLDPLPWLKLLVDEFVKNEGVPHIIQGATQGSGSEGEAKVLYVAYQQIIEYNQLFLEEQIKAQLGIDVEFEFPVSLEPAVKETEKKKGNERNPDTGVEQHG